MAWAVETYFHQDIKPLLPLMQEWTEREFSQYPYLWVPPQGSEIAREVGLIPDEPQSLVAVVKMGERVVGIAGGVVFDGRVVQAYFESLIPPHTPTFAQRLQDQGVDPSRMVHMVFFLTDPAYRADVSLIGLLYAEF